MPSSSQLLSALAAVFTSVNAAMGPYFSTGPVASNSFIRESTATLVLPNAPSGNSGDLSLWVGMGTSNGDLIQSIAEIWQSTDWSVYAYTLLSTGGQHPVQGPSSTAKPGNQVTMHYKFDDNTGNYIQTVLLNGQTVSTLSTSDGHAQGWGSSVECAATDCGTVPAHSWINAKIILDVADPNYSNTLGLGLGATGSMSTSDGGKTWVIGTINIPQFSFSSGGGGSTSPPTGSGAPKWGQCGGVGFTGPTTCAAGAGTCHYSNDWYSQAWTLPDSGLKMHTNIT